jgi:arginase
MSRSLALIGVPSGAGACGVGQDRAPQALRDAGLTDQLELMGVEVADLGDSPPVPWTPDRVNPLAQNLHGVVETVKVTADRVADALAEPDRVVLVMGGDCTVGMGTIAGAQRSIGEIGVIYFDLHSDLNIPATARDGALDWMGLAHMLAIEGSEEPLVRAAGKGPVLDPKQIVLFGHDLAQSTTFERGEIERFDLSRVSVEEVREDPEEAARRALGIVAERFERFVIHLDVDVVDFTDAPLSELSSRNVGLKLEEMLRALSVLAAGSGLVAITLAELNPHNASAEDGLLERFSTSFAHAISGAARSAAASR